MKSLYFIIIITILHFDTSGQKLSRKVSKLVTAIEKDKNYDDEFIGFAMSTSDQYKRFVKLSSIATIQELFILTDHKSPVVRVYTFRALSNRKDIDLFPAIEKHFRDIDSLFVVQGCLISKYSVGDFILELVGPPYYYDNLFRFTDEQKQMIDSVLISENKKPMLFEK